jgi:integrase
MATVEGGRLTKSFTTQREASAWLRDTIRQAEEGLGYHANKTLLKDFLEAWLQTKSSRLRLSTQEQYRRVVKIYLTPGLGKLKMSEVNAARVQAFYDALLAGGTGKRTIEIVHTVLHGALSHARRIGLASSNAAELVEVPRPEKHEMQIWDESEVSQFLAGVAGDGAFYRLAFSTGMRRGELIGLKWSDLDWQTGMLQIRRQVYEPQGGGWRFQEPKTARGKRAIRLGPGLLESMRAHFITIIPGMMSFAGDKWQDHDLIFPCTKGTPRNGYEVTKKFQRLAGELGLPVIRFHDIRHTCASLLLAHGEPPMRVAAILGQSVPVLLETYAHFIPDDSDRAATLMDEITTPVTLPIAQRMHTPKMKVGRSE